MASDIWLMTILIVRKETRCRHIGYSYRLTARVLLYAPSHRQDNTYHGLCYTSRGALAGTRNSSMGPPHEGSIRRPTAPWANALPLSYVPLRLERHRDLKSYGRHDLKSYGRHDLKSYGRHSSVSAINEALNTFYLRLYGVGHMTWDHSDSERRNLLPPLFPINNIGIFYMHHPTFKITHTTTFVTPVVEHWLYRDISQWVHNGGSIQRPIAP